MMKNLLFCGEIMVQYSAHFPKKPEIMGTSGLLSRGPLPKATPLDVEPKNKRAGLINNSLVTVVRYNRRDINLEQSQEENIIFENLFSQKVVANQLL